MDIDQRNEILKKEFIDEQINDINRAIESIPIYDLNIEVFTEGFEDILVADIITIKLTIKRSNLQEGQQVGLTHSLGFTEFFEEKVALTLLIDKKVIVANAVQTISESVTEHTFNYTFPEAKNYKVICDLISLDYKGVNVSKDFEINVCKTSEKRKAHLKEIEKRQIKKIEPSYFQQLLSTVMPIGGDDEEEEEEEEDDKKDDKEKKKKEGEDKDNEKDDEKKENDKEKNEEKNDDKKEENEEDNKEKDEHEKQE